MTNESGIFNRAALRAYGNAIARSPAVPGPGSGAKTEKVLAALADDGVVRLGGNGATRSPGAAADLADQALFLYFGTGPVAARMSADSPDGAALPSVIDGAAEQMSVDQLRLTIRGWAQALGVLAQRCEAGEMVRRRAYARHPSVVSRVVAGAAGGGRPGTLVRGYACALVHVAEGPADALTPDSFAIVLQGLSVLVEQFGVEVERFSAIAHGGVGAVSADAAALLAAGLEGDRRAVAEVHSALSVAVGGLGLGG